MDCDTIRAAISAGLDGEGPGVPGEVTDEHLAGCAACRAWQQRAHTITRRARLGGYVLDHDLAPGVLAALPPHRKRPTWLRAGLLAAVGGGVIDGLALAGASLTIFRLADPAETWVRTQVIKVPVQGGSSS
jgi:Putative zinc-finger